MTLTYDDLSAMRSEWCKLVAAHRAFAKVCINLEEKHRHLLQVQRLCRLIDQLDGIITAGAATLGSLKARTKRVALTDGSLPN